MFSNRKLPKAFLGQLKSLEESFLAESDPIRQSGFGGGRKRWRTERASILEAVETDGDFLDIGCANGFLLECLTRWAAERRMTLTPHGLDQGAKLIGLARRRLPAFQTNFYVGNAWDWIPEKKFQYVYTIYDCVPLEFLEEYVLRVLSRMVGAGGRLIIGSYGSKTKRIPPYDINNFLALRGFSVVGSSQGGHPPVTCFSWLDNC